MKHHPLHKILAPFTREAKRPLAKIIHYFLRRMDRQDQAIAELYRRLGMPLDFTKTPAVLANGDQAVSGTQAFVASHQSGTAADQATLDTFIGAVNDRFNAVNAAVTPAVAPPAAS